MPKQLKPLYKPNRRPARDKGVFVNRASINSNCNHAPNELPNASSKEIVIALACIADEAGIIPGRGCGYEPLKNEYTIVGKSRRTGKAQDFKIVGEAVARTINLARMFNGGRLEVGELTKSVGRNIL